MILRLCVCDNAREVEMEKNECFLLSLSRFVRSENGVFDL